MDGLVLPSPAQALASPCIVFLHQVGFQASQSPRVAAGRSRHSSFGEGASWAHLQHLCTPGWNWPLDMGGWLLKPCPKIEEMPVP